MVGNGDKDLHVIVDTHANQEVTVGLTDGDIVHELAFNDRFSQVSVVRDLIRESTVRRAEQIAQVFVLVLARTAEIKHNFGSGIVPMVRDEIDR